MVGVAVFVCARDWGAVSFDIEIIEEAEHGLVREMGKELGEEC